ncbi:MAG: IS110 family transposase [bacterium]
MEVVVVIGAGLDVHKKRIVACCLDGRSTPPRRVRRTFGTFFKQLEALRDWLIEQGVTEVAMESTGVYWMPVYRILEGHVRVILGNARLMANVPGRKTDQNDAEWIAVLLRHGLIRPNFVPPKPIRELRQLTRCRRKLVQSRTTAQLRVEKMLQMANIKLSSVASQLFGVSGRRMLTALAHGITDPVVLSELSRGTLRKKRPQLIEALTGSFSTDDSRLLKIHLHVVEDLERDLEQIELLIEQKVVPYQPLIQLLDTAPGIDRRIAIEILGEIGTDVSLWPSERHFSAWAGLCPGNRESAGIRRRARSREGNRYLKSILAQAATSAARLGGSYCAARYRRLKSKLGERRAVLALAHELALAVYFMLLRHQSYRPPAAADPHIVKENRRRALINQLHKLGFEVTCSQA